MCGIFAYLGIRYSEEDLKKFAEKIRHRGPDNTTYRWVHPKLFYGFHRLAVNGLNEASNQPLSSADGRYHLICNGEIFNYRALIEKYQLEGEYRTGSDCEIILHLVRRLGLLGACRELDGEYAFVLYDLEENNLMIGRDQLGIRSLFWVRNRDETAPMGEEQIGICSEAKGLVGMGPGLPIEQFPANRCWSSRDPQKMEEIYDLFPPFTEDSEEEIVRKVREKFEAAVEKRKMSERRIACLLSGGLDSSLVVGLLRECHPRCYSIGMEGSIDVAFAKRVAAHLGVEHHIYTPTEAEFLGAIEETIYKIESYDTTSVRASVGNQLITKFIRGAADGTGAGDRDVVLFCGDVSDEIWASYRSYGMAPDDESFYRENVKMLKNIQYFDVLRSDKTISAHGLEARVPFGDVDFVRYVMSIPPHHKRFGKERIEKYLMRRAFDGSDVIDSDVLWRKKEAFSDGVSPQNAKSWFEIIQEYVGTIYSDEDFERLASKYEHNRPYDKESLYYREIFERYYPNQGHMIPYFWRHVFAKNQLDPSARLLSNY